MYYVPDGTQKCGYYECPKCGERFLDIETSDIIPCPYCEMDIDPEVGPDEDINEQKSNAKLIKVVEGEEVEKMDALLSLAITGGNYEWI
ncbi:MAG: FYDLN acid domain-containing protein [Lachnospiraceae bacterium]|nr:FYDLN acid domain-containing protein [Lachnospiraceae bacterium]